MPFLKDSLKTRARIHYVFVSEVFFFFFPPKGFGMGEGRGKYEDEGQSCEVNQDYSEGKSGDALLVDC
jgi:hypothetical protein